MNKIEIKELEEKEQVEKFFKTKVGKEWCEKLCIVNYEKAESPDFKLKTKNGEIIALELTKFLAQNKNLKFSQALTNIGNKICREAEIKYNIHFHILIEKYDERKFSIHWKDHINLLYNPGFSKIPNTKTFKEKLQDLLKNNVELLKSGRLIQEWIQVETDYFKILMDPIACPWTGKYDCHINNIGMAAQNPFDELQICIDKKNKKIKSYIKNCAKCYLLIIVPDAYNANYCSFDEKLFEHNFDSKFEKIFLYDEYTEDSYILY